MEFAVSILPPSGNSSLGYATLTDEGPIVDWTADMRSRFHVPPSIKFKRVTCHQRQITSDNSDPSKGDPAIRNARQLSVDPVALEQARAYTSEFRNPEPYLTALVAGSVPVIATLSPSSQLIR